MPAPYRRAAFVFRRDLRLADNTGLARAAAMAEEVLPCFIFDPAQADPGRNPYFGAPAFQVMLESLEDLDGQLEAAGGRLYRFHGDPAEVIGELLNAHGVDAVFVNRDYTPFSEARDGRNREACEARKIPLHRSHDLLLTRPGQVTTGAGTPYRVFTPFHRAARKEPVPGPAGVPEIRFARPEIAPARSRELDHELLPERRELHARGGRREALRILERLERFRTYPEERNRLAPAGNPAGGATGLGPHNKFGTVSIREVHHAVVRTLGPDHDLARQLYWRDFFTQLAWFEPRVFGNAFRREYDAIPWEDDERLFQAWCAGRTGFPLVDAGMRQLAGSGYLPNRVRMVVASFLVKDLRVDWRRGERWFATHLIDYDPAVNNGNWQWAASTGADAQPWFRIFNPWRQQERHDPDCAYVRRWVPELRDLAPGEVHALEGRPRGLAYPEPVVDHRARAARTKALFAEARAR
ncbi:MAG: cryptochrome/photolyase family protein [Thermoanaerobaculia bacterium]